MSETKIVAVLPADGWRVRHTEGGGSEPIVGWAVAEDGLPVALISDGNGLATTADDWAPIELFHPHETSEVAR